VALVGVASDHLPITDEKYNGSFHAYTGYIERSADICKATVLCTPLMAKTWM